jgi:uncharacterized damage-inducible protein DinB
MSIAQSMLAELDHEMANTRKTLERIPVEKLSWKPDPKSMSLGQLAAHIVEMTGWGTMTLQTDSLNMDPGSHKPLVLTSREQALHEFDKNSQGLRAALSSATDADMMKTWTLAMSGTPLFSMPRVAVIRSMIMNHIIHHRAQLTVYYRLNGVPVPALYGPSADEGAMEASA